MLTGLFNRVRFEEELTAAAARAEQDGHEAAVLMLDLDNFKYVNETYGHKTGDELVAGIAATLQRCLRDTDVLARFGGDEFGVLIAPTTLEQARELAEQLLTAVRDHEMQIDGKPLRISASIGVATFGGKCATAEELLETSTARCTRARRPGVTASRSAQPVGARVGARAAQPLERAPDPRCAGAGPLRALRAADREPAGPA